MVKTINTVANGGDSHTSATHLNALLRALKRLDRRLERAKDVAQTIYGPESETDQYRGLYIGQEEMERLLTREPAALTFQSGGQEPPPLPGMMSDSSPLAWLANTFDLSAFDMDLVLIALASELDLRYERLYAYLQDDISRKRPTVELALSLLCSSAEVKLARHAHFGSDAPLIRHGLLHLVPDIHQVEPPLLAHYLKLDGQIVRFLLGEVSLDPRLVSCCQLVSPPISIDRKEKLPARFRTKLALQKLITRARADYRALRLYFHGLRNAGQRDIAEELASEMGMRLLIVDLVRMPTVDTAFDQILTLLFREARIQDAMLFLDGFDAFRSPELALQQAKLLDALSTHGGVTILVGSQPWIPTERIPGGVISLPFGIPDFAERRAGWWAEIEATGITPTQQDLDVLASRFRLTTGQIAGAVATANNNTLWRTAQSTGSDQEKPGEQPCIEDLFAAARTHSGHEIAALARKVESHHTWDDIVLPPNQMTQLQELCDQARYRHIVYDHWGFDRKLSLGKDLNALLSGPPGTGKTMAAEIIATTLGFDLYKIDLSRVVSKYIGETEKNLDRIFTAAEHSNAVLFFDEADTLFGKRSQVKDAHDRYANIEIGYLLQKMEEYDGIALLATNLRANMDDAFIRRLKFSIEFPFPEEPYRHRIWKGLFPKEAPRSDDIDFAFLARQFKLAGGNIKNIVVNASFLAAARGEPISMCHLILATHREFQKMGKMSLETDFGQYYMMVR